MIQGVGNLDAYVRAMRPDTRPDRFRDYVDFKIKCIRAWGRKSSGRPDVTDKQILAVCRKVGLIRRKLTHLEFCSETELVRIFRWIGQEIFAAGYDSYWNERRS